MATMWPEYKFVQGTQKPLLFIGGYKLLFNRLRANKDGDNTAYFYCVNKLKKGYSCKSSAKALLIHEDGEKADAGGRYVLCSYTANHSELCVPNSAMLQVKQIRESMKSTILANPTVKPSILYNAKVDEVRDTLAEGFREEFDQAMPSRTQLCPSIYAWKRQVIPTEPELAKDIDMNCPHFLTQAGENVCKATIDVAGNPRRRVMLFTTDRVMEAGVRFAERGVMDATFDVSLLSTYLSSFHIFWFTELTETL